MITNVPLGECCEIISGATPRVDESAYWGGDINWATPKDLSSLSGKYIDSTSRKITESGLKSCAASVLPAGSVLFSSRAPIGLVAINAKPMATNQGFKSLVPRPELVDANYLYHWLRSNRTTLKALGNGATFKEISRNVMSRVEVPVLPIDQQRRVAEILDRADALRAKRREAVAHLDELTQSIFLDMFGDPVTNPMSWPRKTISEISRVVTGNTPPRSNVSNYGHAIEWIKSDNISTRTGRLTVADEFLSEAGMRRGRIAPAGSLIMTCIAGSRSSIGNVAIADRAIAFNQQINAIIESVLPVRFLYVQLKLAKRIIQDQSTGGMKGIVSKSKLESISVICPPKFKQDEFCNRIDAIQSMIAYCDTQAVELDILFASLRRRAFRGEL